MPPASKPAEMPPARMKTHGKDTPRTSRTCTQHRSRARGPHHRDGPVCTQGEYSRSQEGDLSCGNTESSFHEDFCGPNTRKETDLGPNLFSNLSQVPEQPKIIQDGLGELGKRIQMPLDPITRNRAQKLQQTSKLLDKEWITEDLILEAQEFERKDPSFRGNQWPKHAMHVSVLTHMCGQEEESDPADSLQHEEPSSPTTLVFSKTD